MSNKEARLAYIKRTHRILPNAVIKAINDPNSVNDPKVIQIIDNLDAELLYTSLREVGLGHMLLAQLSRLDRIMRTKTLYNLCMKREKAFSLRRRT